MKNRQFRGLLVGAISVCTLLMGRLTAMAAEFPDVNSGSWYYPYVQDVSEKGLMSGYSDGRFGPNDKLTRGQFATVLWRMSGSPDMGYSNFADVPITSFYSKACEWARANGVITGYSDGRFGGNDDITREQVATILHRYSGGEASGNIWEYPDANAVSTFARDGMSYAVGSGIISGDGGYLNPQGSVVRAVAATMISRYSGSNGGNDSKPELKPESEASKYSYEIEVANMPKYTLYNSSYIYIHIKTDNPDPDSFCVYGENCETVFGTVAAGGFDDVNYISQEGFAGANEGVVGPCDYVDGGYIYGAISFKVPGAHTIELREGHSWEPGKTLYSTTIEVEDYDAARDAWYKSVIDEVTNDTMSGTEKMDAVCRYVLENFKYLPGDSDGNQLRLLSHQGAFWEAKEIMCWDSTDMMIEFARRFGYEGVPTYAGYLAHYYATVTIDGTQYDYDACPSSWDNIISEWDYVL